MAQPASGAHEPYIMMQDSGHHHQPENPIAIARFIHEADSSWDPLGGRQNGLPLNLGPFQGYTHYRNTTAPSEADTIGPVTMISDSAYGSMPRQSVGIPSVYGDMEHCAETQSLIQGVSDFQLRPDSSPETIPPPDDPSEKQPWSGPAATADLDADELVCHCCKASVKTKSELKYVIPLRFSPQAPAHNTLQKARATPFKTTPLLLGELPSQRGWV